MWYYKWEEAVDKKEELEKELTDVKRKYRKAIEHIETLVKNFPTGDLLLRHVFALNSAEEFLTKTKHGDNLDHD